MGCTSCVITPPVGPLGECTLWGDPHIRTFDHIRSDYYSPGEFWIVKSKNVWIQGRYLPDESDQRPWCHQSYCSWRSFLERSQAFRHCEGCTLGCSASFDGLSTRLQRHWAS